MLNVRDQFPIFANNPDAVFLDSASTSQKPQVVIDAVTDYICNTNANTGRASYTWSQITDEMIETTRGRVRNFVAHTIRDAEVHFTSGTTQALQRVANDWLLNNAFDGANIVVAPRDHQANYLPWINACNQLSLRGVKVDCREIRYNSDDTYDLTHLGELVDDNTLLVCVTHISHTTGHVLDLEQVRKTIGSAPRLCVDIAQSFGHIELNLALADVDFAAFSGHKAFALPGTGGLWVNKSRTGALATGALATGELPTGKSATRELATNSLVADDWQGTPNTAGIISLGAAIDYLEALGMGNVNAHTCELTSYCNQMLKSVNGVVLLSDPRASKPYTTHGICSFTIDGVTSGDIGFALDSYNVMVRANALCRANATSDDEMIRVSFHVYNTLSDVDRLIETLRAITA